MLTAVEVAAIVGISRSHVARWCARRGIGRVGPDAQRRYLYPAEAVREAHARDTYIPPELQLRRWVARALIA